MGLAPLFQFDRQERGAWSSELDNGKEGLDAHQKHSINNKIGLPGRCSQRAVDLSSCLLNKKVFTNVAKGLESCEESKFFHSLTKVKRAKRTNKMVRATWGTPLYP